ncbi:hypothetical protein ILP97_23320 [Amycolatopsis sp. H6(2020)]|nr:hypothetical protein [Amycolatopsis sp. H6(2020)]
MTLSELPAGRAAALRRVTEPYPGGIMVTHANVPANARQAAQVLGGSAVVTRLPPSRVLPLAGEGRW